MRQKKNHEESEEEQQGAPKWMVTFSDCMTLLLTFFVLLLSFSSFDVAEFEYLKSAFAQELPSVSLVRAKPSVVADTVLMPQIKELDKGSEKPTLERGSENNLQKEEEEPTNIHDRKVFLSFSDKLFLGKGAVISLQGRKALSYMASFLKQVPNRVVISENGPLDKKDSKHSGLQRAWAVQKYFITKHGLDKNKFSIAADTLQKNFDSGTDSDTKSERVLEIILLERSIYD